uniref:ATP synthase subunit b n=1 Tax=Ditylenchus dipsaci TaxID=166011 RepID=A0A915EGV7_9BILA
MVLSRFLVQNQASNQNVLRNLMVVTSVRSSSHVAVTGEHGESLSRKSSSPGFFKKLSMRLHGIPLPGEAQAPTLAPTLPKDFKEFPERDLVNFPYPEQHMFPPKTRMMIIPDSWMTPLQKITGTSGPYLFIGSVLGFMLNKEWVVFDESFMKLEIVVIMYLILSRSFGYRIDQHCYKVFKERVEDLKSVVDSELKDAVEFRKSSAAESDLKLPTAKNVDAVSNELKRRIDYLQEVEATKMRFERDILLKSIIQGVNDQISKNEGNIKDAFLDNCISQLKSIPA